MTDLNMRESFEEFDQEENSEECKNEFIKIIKIGNTQLAIEFIMQTVWNHQQSKINQLLKENDEQRDMIKFYEKLSAKAMDLMTRSREIGTDVCACGRCYLCDSVGKHVK